MRLDIDRVRGHLYVHFHPVGTLPELDVLPGEQDDFLSLKGIL